MENKLLSACCLLTACWYFTASSNAVASQLLFRDYRRSTSEGTSSTSSLAHAALLLTTVELIVGSLIAALFWAGNRNALQNMKAPSKIINLSMSELAGGMFHSFGCFLTNCGFAFGSASLVQVVKLLEPIETLILVALVDAVVHSRQFHIPCKKLAAVLMIVSGTSLLMTSGGISSDTNWRAVLCALISGVCMSSRNVLEKNINSKKGSGNSVFWSGLASFTRITLTGAVFASIATAMVAMVALQHQQFPALALFPPSRNALKAIMYFSCYQIASIMVLSLTSAPTHSLLNVGKRIVSVIFAAHVFSNQLGALGWTGLAITAIGGFLYSRQSKKTTTQTNKGTSIAEKCLAKKWHRSRGARLIFIVGAFSVGRIIHLRNIELGGGDISFSITPPRDKNALSTKGGGVPMKANNNTVT